VIGHITGTLKVSANSSVVVIGSVTISENSTLVIGGGSTIVVQGCANINGSIVIVETTVDQESSLSFNPNCSSITARGYFGSSDLPGNVAAPVACVTTTGTVDTAKGIMTLVTTQTKTSDCTSKPRKIAVWVVPVSATIGALVLIIILVILLATFNKRVQKVIAPSWYARHLARKMETKEAARLSLAGQAAVASPAPQGTFSPYDAHRPMLSPSPEPFAHNAFPLGGPHAPDLGGAYVTDSETGKQSGSE
jgi:hypothetical protein